VPGHDARASSTTEGLPVAPSMGPTLQDAHVAVATTTTMDRRMLWICALCILLALAAGLVAQLLTRLIYLCTHLAFYGRIALSPVSPWAHQLGLWVVLVPVVGGVLVGLMARYGSKAIRGHGIPEAMENVLYNKSRIPARMTFLKPISAAIAIGTGGPFGAEGPIIATGGALGSLLGQALRMTGDERKTLLAAGAVAGMAATFGAPVAALLLAVELLLFEYRPRSLVPVALATATATGVRIAFEGGRPAFLIPDLVSPGPEALALYIVIGALVGLGAVLATRAVYAVEDAFEKVPLHWMWWPALGGLGVGLVGLLSPRTLGVGYANIEDILSGGMTVKVVLLLCALKFVSWAIALGSGTSGGTLAPLFTLGSGLGAALGFAATLLLPAAGVDVRVAALVGMGAMFAGASRALLTSVVFAFETVRQPLGLLPLLGGCTAAFVVSSLLMPHSIMTEKIARRGGRVLSDYGIDHLARVLVREHCARNPVVLAARQTLQAVRAWLGAEGPGSSHQGFPVVDGEGYLVGVVTRRQLLAAKAPEACVGELITRPPLVAFEDDTLREAADLMVREDVGRLPVVTRNDPRKVVGILTRSDLLASHGKRLDELHRREEATLFRGVARG
jgi:CIC family chloride channel protein